MPPPLLPTAHRRNKHSKPMPRKSGVSVASAAPLTDTNGDVSIISDVASTASPARPNTTVSMTEPASPSRTKSQAQSSKAGAEKGGRKLAGNGETEEGGVEKSGKSIKAKGDDLTIDDLLLPRSLVSRLSRGSLPPNTSLQKDALLALTKSATVFISYLAHTANNLTSRKTIQAADVLEAIREMELQGIMGPRLEGEVHLFDEGVKGKRKGYRDRVKARESTGTAAGQDGTGENNEGEEEDTRHQNKRARRVEEDIEMDGAPSHRHSTSAAMGTDADLSGQLMTEGAHANNIQGQVEVDGNDQTESDPDVMEDEEEEGEDDQEDEQEDEEEEDEEINEDGSQLDEEEVSRRKQAELLAPNGREEIGSEDESD